MSETIYFPRYWIKSLQSTKTIVFAFFNRIFAVLQILKAQWSDSMLQILVIFNYLLIKEMTDLNYFVSKETTVQTWRTQWKILYP